MVKMHSACNFDFENTDRHSADGKMEVAQRDAADVASFPTAETVPTALEHGHHSDRDVDWELLYALTECEFPCPDPSEMLCEKAIESQSLWTSFDRGNCSPASSSGACSAAGRSSATMPQFLCADFDAEVNSPVGSSDRSQGQTYAPARKQCSTSTPPRRHSSDRPAGAFSRRTRRCLADDCRADISNLKEYYRRRKLCDGCINKDVIQSAGKLMRFCQQCSKVHDIEAFDGSMRSCREKLQMHRIRARRTFALKGRSAAIRSSSTLTPAISAALQPKCLLTKQSKSV